MSVDTAVIPVAGLGTRMLPVTRLVPKEFLPLGRKAAIQRVAEELCDAGVKRLIFVVSPRKASLSNLFGEADNRLSGFEDVEFDYVVQQEQLGLGHAILCAAEAAGEVPFVVALGDCVIGLPKQSQILSHLVNAVDATSGIAIGFEKVATENTYRYGIAVADSDAETFDLKGIVEKPEPGTAPSNLAICGRYVLQPSIFDALRSTGFDSSQEIQLTDALNSLIQNGVPATGVRLESGVKRYDIGNMESFTAAFADFAMHDSLLRNEIVNACEPKNESFS